MRELLVHFFVRSCINSDRVENLEFVKRKRNKRGSNKNISTVLQNIENYQIKGDIELMIRHPEVLVKGYVSFLALDKTSI